MKTFKHDFFAATALYGGPAGRIILKTGRQAKLFGLSTRWIGRFLTFHEARMYRTAGGIAGIPAFLGTHGDTAFVHAFVEGGPLRKETTINDEFFPALEGILHRLHERGMAYVDLEKRENILVGDDGRPHLIDFQISWHIPANRLGQTWPARMILRILQGSDEYHLLKHWRRLRPDQLTPEQLARSERPPFWIAWHRRVFRPVTHLRRRLLVRLGERSSHRTRSPG